MAGKSSQQAVELGVELAAAENAEVIFLHVVPPIDFVAGRMSLPAVPRRLQSAGDEALDDAAVVAGKLGVRFGRDRIAGYAGDTIVEWGRRGRRGHHRRGRAPAAPEDRNDHGPLGCPQLDASPSSSRAPPVRERVAA